MVEAVLDLLGHLPPNPLELLLAGGALISKTACDQLRALEQQDILDPGLRAVLIAALEERRSNPHTEIVSPEEAHVFLAGVAARADHICLGASSRIRAALVAFEPGRDDLRQLAADIGEDARKRREAKTTLSWLLDEVEFFADELVDE